jgi:hemolysin III
MLSKDGSVHVTDEVWNTRLSAFGAVLSIVGFAFLILQRTGGDAWRVLSFSVYGISLFGMFLSSALHHGINGSPKTNHWLRQLDYFAISVMIAGTFTPFCLDLGSRLGWVVLWVVWTLAVASIALKALWPHVPRWLMTSLFIGMGWMGLVVAKPVYELIHASGFLVLLGGGLFFTVGGIVYGLEKPNPCPGRFGFHEIWHCFVLAGAASHFYVVYRYL